MILGDFNSCNIAQNVVLVKDNENCEVFYDCFTRSRFLCPNNMAFNSILQICDYPRNVPTCHNYNYLFTAPKGE